MATSMQTYDVQIADVEYLNHGAAPLLARIFRPQGSGPFPIMIELHGGAWVRGNRENGDDANEALAKNGVIVVALDFTVPPEAPYPASMADIHYGVRWAKTQAAGWNGIPDRVGAMGTSSGAHQAMLLGMRPDDSRYAALAQPTGSAAVDGTLACVILVSPVIDPLGRYRYAKGLRDDITPPEGMAERGVEVHVLPATASLDDVLAVSPDGLFYSNGPGDPAATTHQVEVLQGALAQGVPYFGICFGNQLFGRALGFGTYKLTYGHRGINQPVMDRTTGKVEVTAHNHGFAVDGDTLPANVEQTHVSLFDGTNCGIAIKGKRAFGVQYHPEASPGPQDSFYLFEKFVEML